MKFSQEALMTIYEETQNPQVAETASQLTQLTCHSQWAAGQRAPGVEDGGGGGASSRTTLIAAGTTVSVVLLLIFGACYWMIRKHYNKQKMNDAATGKVCSHTYVFPSLLPVLNTKVHSMVLGTCALLACLLLPMYPSKAQLCDVCRRDRHQTACPHGRAIRAARRFNARKPNGPAEHAAASRHWSPSTPQGTQSTPYWTRTTTMPRTSCARRVAPQIPPLWRGVLLKVLMAQL